MMMSRSRLNPALALVPLSTLGLAGCGGDAANQAGDDDEAAAEEQRAAEARAMLLDPASLAETAPETFRAEFETSKGTFVIEATRAWAPLGADRFYALVKNGYYDGVRFFRVVEGFIVQFGMHGDPEINSVWSAARIQDDSVAGSNTRGMVTYAKGGANTRTTQVFINFGDNSRLDADGFAPFGQVVEGMDVVDQLHSGYGESSPRGDGPAQGQISAGGNAYLTANFPDLDYVVSARIAGAEN